MANTFRLTLKAQNNHPASTVVGAVTHQVPDQTVSEQSLQSAVAEFTSGASNTVAIGASGVVTVSGTTQKDPVTGSNLNFTNHRGLGVSVERADADTAPTYAANGVTSTTSLAIATGSKVFTVAASGGWIDGTRVRAVSAANHDNWMEGTVTYSATSLTMTVDTIGGTGTLADWTLYTVPCAQITSTNFCGVTVSTALPLVEGSSIALFHDYVSLSNSDVWKKKATNGQTLTISLAGVTGLKASVFVLGD
jgi:hypothetical protein